MILTLESVGVNLSWVLCPHENSLVYGGSIVTFESAGLGNSNARPLGVLSS